MTENHEECNEATTEVAEVWSQLSEFPEVVAGSTVGKFAPVNDGGATAMGEFGRLHCQHRIEHK